MRQNFSSGAKWEERVGYSRAVKFGAHLEISGTVAVDDAGAVVGLGSEFEQTLFILEKVKGILQTAGYDLTDVVRTRIYVTEIANWQKVGEAHAQFFGEVKPATSMVEVSGLISPEYLVEIEVSAYRQVKDGE